MTWAMTLFLAAPLWLIAAQQEDVTIQSVFRSFGVGLFIASLVIAGLSR